MVYGWGSDLDNIVWGVSGLVMITIFGITLHVYGFLIGLGSLVAYLIIEHEGKKDGLAESEIAKMTTGLFLGAIIGARAWHVWTDWHLYAGQPLDAFAIWNGGLSILGALVGGAIVLGLMRRLQKSKHEISLAHYADLAAFGVPVGQMIGRLGNAFNQELYGLPTDLPWKLYIAPENRLDKYSSNEYFHPLFAYEIVLMGIFVLVSLFLQRLGVIQRGKGSFAVVYALYYATIRFLLDFLRVDKQLFAETSLGLNQVVMFLFIGFLTVVLVYKKIRRV